MKLAAFPWDPKPEAAAPPPVAAPPAPIPNPASYTQATLSPPPNANALSLPTAPQHGAPMKTEPLVPKAEPLIKAEPGAANGQGVHAYPAANSQRIMPNQGGGVAAARATQALESQYGQRAAASISAIHSSMQGPVPGQQQQMPRPGQHPQHPHLSQQQMQPNAAQQYQRNMTAQMMAAQQQQQQRAGQQQPPANAPNGLPQSQVDGSSDFEGILMKRDAEGNPVEMGRVDIDNLIAEKIASRAKQMEGGGLMLPLREATRHRSIAKKHGTAGPSQFDGDDDDLEEDDVDAINSDLDDPEEEPEDSDDDGEELGDMMLCMYDKVQRVKNKW